MSIFTNQETAVINQALSILESKLKVEKYECFSTSQAVKNYCMLKFGALEREVFAVLFLNSKNQLIACDVLFYGTVDGATVYPREVVKAALAHNAKFLIICHNHPSGNTTPSQADKLMTSDLKSALKLFDIPLLDHIIVSQIEAFSFAEYGIIDSIT